MALLPNQGPPRPKTHTPMPPDLVMRLRAALLTHLAGQPATLAAIEAVAAAEKAEVAQVYATLAFDPSFVVDVSHETLIAICVGVCQEQGALDNLKRLLERRHERLAAGKPAFDIIPRSCLDMCAHSPVCLSRGPHGQAAHPRLKPEGVDELLGALLE